MHSVQYCTVPYPYSRKPLHLFGNLHWDSKPHTHKKVSPAAFLKIYLFEAMENNDLSITVAAADRSEEHTSELQSRETISYAVFCLKKKNK